MVDHTFKNDFTCTAEIGGSYNVNQTFNKASFNVTFQGERVAGDDVGFPVNTGLDVNGQCVRFSQANEDVAPQIALYPGSC
jgi:hypothetical protein